jgi:hypothetical protein
MFLFFEAIITRALESIFYLETWNVIVTVTVSGSRKNPFPFVFYVAGCASSVVARNANTQKGK